MSITLKEFFIGQNVYAQNRQPVVPVSSLKPVGTTNGTIEQQLTNSSSASIEILSKESCEKDLIKTRKNEQCVCKNGMSPNGKDCLQTCESGYVEKDGVKQNECLKNTAGDLGIKCDPNQLINGTCSRNINKTLGIRGSDTTPSPTVLLQDIVLSATSFVGTVIMIALVVMGIKYVKDGFNEESTGDLKGNIKKLLIGLFLVIGSYTIIRLIQYVARGY